MSFSGRHSIYSTTSGSNPFATPGGSNAQVTTSSLLAALHNSYQNAYPHNIDASTVLVVNSTDGERIVLDETVTVRAWEHARRRAEDQTILLSPLQTPGPSLLGPVLSTFPQLPGLVQTAVSVVQAFTNALTPFSPVSIPLHNGLAVTIQINLAGVPIGAALSLSTAGLNTQQGLLNIPSEKGYRAFDVFYHLLSSATTDNEREYLALKRPEDYKLLARSGTYTLPRDSPTADDEAAAEDFRAGLRALNIKKSDLRGLLSILASLLLLGNSLGLLLDEEVVEEVCEDVASLLGLEPEVLSKKIGESEREIFIETVYELLLEWVIYKTNLALADDFAEQNRMAGVDGSEGGDSVTVAVLEVSNEKMGRALCLKNIFDDENGLNLEMSQDGVKVLPSSGTVVREMKQCWIDAEKEGLVGVSRDREYIKDRQEGIIEKVGREAEEGAFLKDVLFPQESYDHSGIPRTKIDVFQQLSASRVWYHLNVSPVDPSSEPTNGKWSAAVVSKQLRAWRLPEWANRRVKRLDFTSDFDMEEFPQRYQMLGCRPGRDGVETWVIERGWSNGDVVVGSERVWMSETSWWEAEQMLDLKPMGGGMDTGYSAATSMGQSGYFGAQPQDASRDNLLRNDGLLAGNNLGYSGGNGGEAPRQTLLNSEEEQKYVGALDPELGKKKKIVAQPIGLTRRIWVAIVWMLTFWIPSFLLRFVGRMKRPDVRMAWREKLVLCFGIVLLNGAIIFVIIFFGKLICPGADKVWTAKDVSFHTGEEDYWASFRGKVYDLTDFYPKQHSSTNEKVSPEAMLEFAGKDLTTLFPIPMHLACSGFGLDENYRIQINDTEVQDINPRAIHKSGMLADDRTSKIGNKRWYGDVFIPIINEYKKGDLVWNPDYIRSHGKVARKPWAIYKQRLYDLTDYFKTLEDKRNVTIPGATNYFFLPEKVTDVFENHNGKDITKILDDEFDLSKKADRDLWERVENCLDNAFYYGKVDFRREARCQFTSIILAVFAGIMCAIILIKFLSALQLGSKRRPAMQDKFVICQVPAYTEGEDQLRKALDSLTALSYDNKRKLICVICDGMVVGGGNDKPTPNIVLDILGVDPKIDPPALPFQSVGEGSAALNYGKVYSGLYEFEGCVVPYIVVVKVGKPNESSKPGNRGKRDSQILLLNFLNRVHHRIEMNPLELEMFHQINNIIGVDPELYEYLLMVDADTTVKEDSLTRLIASCSNDAKIAGICGETSLENEGGSWWTMIQVYEYYISHHLAKAFESLFGSVTCLPGCFCMYRIRSADKGAPLVISRKLIDEYAEPNVDTLHKKNLLSLGEDRFLTTLMTKHFPRMSYKFVPDAYAYTAAPDTWEILLSQRRRWINSTIHNLAELVLLEELCGFCCFSMRFVVFIDLFGTLILPSTCIYIGYLIYLVSSKSGAFPLISIIMIAAVYGLQALIFIIKRQWQHIGWMVIYILAFPIYSFILPIYSFWNQDNFTWGSTRIVIGESGDKKVVAEEEEEFDPSKIPMQSWDDYAAEKNLPGRRNVSHQTEKFAPSPYGQNDMYEMDDMRSMYSSAKPASTILTHLPHMSTQHFPPPHSPQPPMNRQSTYSALGGQDYWQAGPHRSSVPSTPGLMPSTDNLLAGAHTPPGRGMSRSPLGQPPSRPMSTIDLLRSGGDFDEQQVVNTIRAVLREVDLDSVTKKQVRALVEQRLGMEFGMNRRAWADGLIDAELEAMI